MEIDINTSRQHREGVGVATPQPCVNEGLKGSHGAGSMYDEVLSDALRQCIVMRDYEKASSRWLMAERMALKLGAPLSLVLEYGDRLTAHYEQPQKPLVKVDVNSPGNQIAGTQNNYEK